MGYIYFKGTGGLEANINEAIRYFTLSAEQGHAIAQFILGTLYLFGNGVSLNFTESFKYFRSSADQGNDLALIYLGYSYRYGYGVPQDDAEAFKYYKLAADKRNNLGLWEVGRAYCEGRGVSLNFSEGIKYLKSSAEQGFYKAYRSLGEYLEKQNDFETAFYYYKLAADKGGDEKSHLKVGTFLLNEKGVKQNFEEAVKYIQVSADQKNYYALYWMGQCYLGGKGVPIDHTKAFQYFKEAADLIGKK